MSFSVILPVLPLRDFVMFPYMISPLVVDKDKSVEAVHESVRNCGREILLIAQRVANVENPNFNSLYKVGTVGRITQELVLSDGSLKILVEGLRSVKILSYQEAPNMLKAVAEPLEDMSENFSEKEKVFASALVGEFEQYAQLNKTISKEIIADVKQFHNPNKVAFTIVSHMDIKMERKQKFLSIVGTNERLDQVLEIIEG